MNNISDHRSETWVAKAIYLNMDDKNEEALIALESAIDTDRHYIFAYQVKGKVLHEMGRYDEAIMAFRKGYMLSRNIQVYEGL
jgi:tetratricopeptide (TPR) repeat protein